MASTTKPKRAPQSSDDDLKVFDIAALLLIFDMSKPTLYDRLIKPGYLRTFKIGRVRGATGRAIRDCQERLEQLAAEQDAIGFESNVQKGRQKASTAPVDPGELPEPVGGVGRRTPRKARTPATVTAA